MAVSTAGWEVAVCVEESSGVTSSEGVTSSVSASTCLLSSLAVRKKENKPSRDYIHLLT